MSAIARKLRAAARLVAICATTAGLWTVWLAGAPFLVAAPRARLRWRYALMGAWARRVARVAGIRVATEGPIPRPPFLLVANHLSYVDIIVLSSVLDCCYVSRGDVRDWPVVGLLCRSMRVIFVDRSRRADVRRVADEMEARLAEGEGVVLFPEGTSTAGDRVDPFKPSLFDCAVRARVPVHYAALGYATDEPEPPAHLAVCWWGEMTFAGHLPGLLELSRVHARVAFGPEPIAGDDRKELARALRSAVDALFVPVVAPERLAELASAERSGGRPTSSRP
jgi:1-acyl-sn-glycerol-3-phosphate acyltransferase